MTTTTRTRRSTTPTASSPTNTNGDTIESTGVEDLLRLLSVEEKLSPELRCAINEKANNLLNDLSPDIAHFLHYELNDQKQSEDDIRTLIQCVPNALSYEDEDGRLPIENAVWRYTSNNTLMDTRAVSFVPLLAEEGMKHNVGGEGTRGGLLRNDEDECNVLNNLSRVSENDRDVDHVSFDLQYLNAIKRLRQMNLFQKEHIQNHDLLWESCDSIRSYRFNYLADWEPALLRESQSQNDVDGDGDGDSLLHWCTSLYDISVFKTVLRTTLRHFPHELGLLLLENSQGCTPFRKAYQEFGKEEAWKTIQTCLDESASASESESDAGNKTRIIEKDPNTNMYPFMFAAAGDTSELDLIFSLVRRDPVVLLGAGQCGVEQGKGEIVSSRKRKNTE
jgi:hypothetical protein